MNSPKLLSAWATTARLSLLMLTVLFSSDVRAHAAHFFTPFSLEMQADTTRDTVFTCDPLEVGERTDTLTNSSGADSLLITTTLLQPFLFSQIGKDIDGKAAEDGAGWSVSISADGSRLAVGAPLYDVDSVQTGQTRVYAWEDSMWTQLGQDIEGELPFDNAGSSVSLSADGSRVAVASSNNNGSGIAAGHVRVFSWEDSVWMQVGQNIEGEAGFDRSGSSVSLSADGNRLAIGARLNDGSVLTPNSGHARVYAWDDSTWTQLGQDLNGEATEDQAGWSVSLSADGNRVAVGAPFNKGSGNAAGHVRVYAWSDTVWMQIGSDIDAEAAVDRFGFSVSLSADGSRLAVGAVGNSGSGPSAGHTRVFTWTGSVWTQLGNDLDGEAAMDESGYSVSLSDDGQLLAVGATFNDGNDSLSGHVRVYVWEGNAWTQVGQDIDGEATLDQSGYSISLSSDGGRLAVGAPYNDGNGEDAGHVRVFDVRPLTIDTLSLVVNVCDSLPPAADTALFTSFTGNCDSLVITTYVDTCFITSLVQPESEAIRFTAAPNPFDGEVRFLLNAPRATELVLSIYDGQGRLVQQIQPRAMQREQALRWQGRDPQGRLLPAGLYVARLTGPGIDQTLKLVKR